MIDVDSTKLARDLIHHEAMRSIESLTTLRSASSVHMTILVWHLVLIAYIKLYKLVIV